MQCACMLPALFPAGHPRARHWEPGAEIAFWHYSDLTACPPNVRYRREVMPKLKHLKPIAVQTAA
jgi:hypothetical protein